MTKKLYYALVWGIAWTIFFAIPALIVTSIFTWDWRYSVLGLLLMIPNEFIVRYTHRIYNAGYAGNDAPLWEKETNGSDA